MDRDPRYKLRNTSQEPNEWRPDKKKSTWQPPSKANESYEPEVNPADFLANKNDSQNLDAINLQADQKASGASEMPTVPSTKNTLDQKAKPITSEAPSVEHQNDKAQSDQPQPPHQKSKSLDEGNKSRKAIVIAGIVFGVILLGIIAFLILRWFQTPSNAQQSVLDRVVRNGLETTSFKEDTVVSSQDGEQSTITRIVSFKEPGVMTVYISGLRKTGTNDTFEIIVDDRDAFVRPNISSQTLNSATEAQKNIYNTIQDQWIQIIKDTQSIKSKEANLINANSIFDDQRVLLPETFIVGLFNVNQKDQLTREVDENSIYTPTSAEPARDIIDSIEAWKFNVSVDVEGARVINQLAASMLDEEFYSSAVNSDSGFPQTVELWASRSTSELLQYKYTLNSQNITVRYSEINQSVQIPSIDDPKVPANIDDQVTDEVQKDRMYDIVETLIEKRSQGIAFPPDNASFEDFVSHQLPSHQKEGLTLKFAKDDPGRYDIFYQPKSACSKEGGLVDNENANTFTLRTNLATSGKYCIDNQE